MIGNGPSVLEHPYSSLIDLFGDVVRFNTFQIDFDDPLHKKCLGTKCTIVFLNELGKSYDNFVINYKKNKKNCIGFVKYVLGQGNAGKKSWFYDTDLSRPLSNILCVIEMADLTKLELQLSAYDAEKDPYLIRHPSAGLQAISHFYNLYDIIHIVGFDGKVDNFWYYKENSITGTPEGLESNYHNYEEEQRFINYLIKKKKIRLLADVFNGSV